MQFKLVINGALPDLNKMIAADRGNKYVAAKLKKHYTNLVAWYCKQQKIPSVNAANFVFNWYCKDKRKDKDNISGGGRKYIFDGLIVAGVLQNDGWKQIGKWEDNFCVDKYNPRTEVIIFPKSMV